MLRTFSGSIKACYTSILLAGLVMFVMPVFFSWFSGACHVSIFSWLSGARHASMLLAGMTRSYVDAS